MLGYVRLSLPAYVGPPFLLSERVARREKRGRVHGQEFGDRACYSVAWRSARHVLGEVVEVHHKVMELILQQPTRGMPTKPGYSLNPTRKNTCASWIAVL